jgi:hypothetical protein
VKFKKYLEVAQAAFVLRNKSACDNMGKMANISQFFDLGRNIFMD